MFVDSHCHLTFPELASRLPEIRQAMAQAQVDRALCICTTLEEFDAVHALAMQYGNFWATVGVHPDNEDVAEPGLFRVTELWDGRAALSAHFDTPHMRQWVEERAALGFHDRRIALHAIGVAEEL